ncbi:MAG: endonuclease III [Clostridiales Family XIII bacterium]|jgi:endonuclease-3|nr:endonuclease III [Clostridiales Family XIII bacterium]
MTRVGWEVESAVKALSKKDCVAALDLLAEAYPQAACALNYHSLFELITAVVLSAQTTDKSVNLVTPELFARYPGAAEMADADETELEDILRRIGMYRTKAKNIRLMAQALRDEHGGEPPDSFDELVKLPGVGRKSANVVLSVGFGHQRIAVDTHVFRIANKVGFCHERDVLKTELALMRQIPENRWTEAHHSLIFHGRNCCFAKKPDCGRCVINGYCMSFGGSNAARS